MLNYIPDDGYTEKGFIEAIPQMYNEVRFTYRPILMEEQTRWTNESQRLKDEVWGRKVSVLMVDRLKSWDIINQHGETLPITADNILRLKPTLFMRLYSILLGTDASNLDPEWDDEEKNYQVTNQTADTNVGATREENNSKNS